MIDPTGIRARFTLLLPHLDERRRRLFAATEARTAGYGGIAAVSRATGIAVSTIGRGLKELATAARLDADRVRRPGGGRKPLVATDAALLDDLLALVAPSERGDPMSPLRWTCKSREGSSHPDRDAQFAYISQSVSAALAEQQPVISVDAKKKELVGDFRNGGREWHPQGQPEEVWVHDFLIKELGRAGPYGISDLAAHAGWVSVGMDHDTAAFAVQTIRRWWHEIGHVRYPGAKRLVITADGGGSNGSRVRLWKRALQGLATELGIDIMVHHLPPGTSKWNTIEHRLFSFISQNWRAKPLVSYRVIVDLISATTTDTGLTVRCELDANPYPKGIAVSDQEMAAINITRADFHGEWNYTIQPSNRSNTAVDP